ncbi:S41 family peptidase [Magnetospirillum moscoviense]|uniref:PDZ domain-containing protein n=1 Tax=Magnetospirillum moscoviense TaxID=1437059 RepID=A0A178MU44_9PROT|nr:S41 family peptidase [Magnetospirillum moscoviense]OAN53790.1 hypothetical protein A6A05_09585 [Magnetospirillum moscoviense]
MANVSRAALFLVVLLQAGCAQKSVPLACFDTSPGRGTAFGQALELTVRAHGTAVRAEQLALAGLNGLAEIDPDLSFTRTRDHVRVEVKGKPPFDKNAVGGLGETSWREISAELVRSAARLSGAVDAAPPERIQQVMVDAMLAAHPPQSLPCAGSTSPVARLDFPVEKPAAAGAAPKPVFEAVAHPAPRTRPALRETIGRDFVQMMHTVLRIHLEPVSADRFVADGLAGLSDLDPSLRLDGRPLEPLEWEPAINAAISSSPRLKAQEPTDLFAKMADKALSGLGSGSRFVPVSVQQMAGAGIVGVALDQTQTGGLIIRVQPRSPAARAGLSPGDRIVAVDGVPVGGRTGEEVAARLRGQPQSTVTLTVQLAKTGGSVNIGLVRAYGASIDVDVRDRLVWVTAEAFQQGSVHTIGGAIKKAIPDNGPKSDGMVLDLRGCAGGSLHDLWAAAAMFEPGISPFVLRQRQSWPASPTNGSLAGLGRGVPLVVLVDRYTAGGCELLADHLQAKAGAVGIGVSTAAKAIIQDMLPMGAYGSVRLTTGRIEAADGRRVDGIGMIPTLCTANASTVSEVLAQLDDGRAGQARAAALGSDVARLEQRSHCPASNRAGQSLEQDVARRLLSDPGLYAKARGAG